MPEKKTGGVAAKLNVLWLSDITDQADRLRDLRKTSDELKHSREKVRRALDSVPVPIWMRNAELELTWCNQAYSRAVDATRGEVIDQQIELVPGGASGRHKNMARRAVQTNSAQQYSKHIVIGGQRRLMEITEQPAVNPVSNDSNDATDKLVGHALDRTKTEELQQDLKRYRTTTTELMGQLNTAIAIFDPNQQLDFYNQAFCDLWQLQDIWLDTNPMLGEMLDVMREQRRLPEQADFQHFKQSWLDMFTDLIEPHEDMLHLPDGTSIRVLVVPHPMGGLLMTFEDVTSRLELESSYNTLMAVQRETLNNLAEGLAVFGSDGRIKLWNPAFKNMWQFTDNFLNNEPHMMRIVEKMEPFFDPLDWEIVQEELANNAIVREGRSGRLQLSDGRVLEYVTVPLPDGGILNRFSDVTDSLRVEHALLEKNAALEEAERLKLDFLANVSYQLRTPLNAMMGFAEVLRKEFFGPLNDRQMEYAEGMIDAGETLINLVNDILDLSTIEAGYLALNIEEVDVHDLLQTVYDVTADWARKEGVTLELETPDDLGGIRADGRRIKQALLNLVSNGIKFTPEGGKIIMSAFQTDRHMAFRVEDTGIGIPLSEHERIFGAFAKVDSQGRRRGEGAGLGLSLVKSIVELQGGRIEIDSEPNIGTSVTCYIPYEVTEPEVTEQVEAGI
jgi:signal transduction histidine kinase